MLSTTPKTIYLIDGYAQFFRAYHAIRTPMTSPVTMEPTNLTFGFVGMLLKLLRGEGANLGGKPDYVAVALDVSGDRGTFRTQLYPQYKANRPPPPDDLKPQVDRCLDLLRAIGVPVIGVEGFEADDVIAALVQKFSVSDPGLRVRIISKDKDFKQLLRQGGDGGASVEMYDIHKDEVIDAASLKADLGLRPDQIVDMLTLMGDTTDNVPGVEGVGAKTAAKLLIEFGTLDALMARAEEIKGKRGEKLREAADRLELSRQLVTLRTDIDVPLNLLDARAAEFALSALIPILKELGFNRYQDDVRAMIGLEAPTPVNRPAQAAIGTLFAPLHEPASIAQGDYMCVRTKDELDAMLVAIEAASVVAVDTETTGLRPMECKLCGLSFSIKAGSAWYVPVRSPEPASHLDEKTVLDTLRGMLEDESKPKVGHNLKYDLLVLRNHGVELRGFTRTRGGMDTMVASYLIDASRSSHALDALSLALLGRQNVSIKELIGKGKSQKTFDQVPLEQASPYAAEDADVSLQIAAILGPQLEAMGLDGLARDLELPLVDVLAELEWNGIQVEPDELDRQRERLDVRIVELREQIQRASMESVGRGFDVDSPRQLSGILFNDPEAVDPGLGIKPTKKPKT
ncbi:MAG: hypothetical protein IIC49_06750, partial [Planctomycetes bacterium]|nr:hypothetical protein [Planctomycetota bacterium]